MQFRTKNQPNKKPQPTKKQNDEKRGKWTTVSEQPKGLSFRPLWNCLFEYLYLHQAQVRAQEPVMVQSTPIFCLWYGSATAGSCGKFSCCSLVTTWIKPVSVRFNISPIYFYFIYSSYFYDSCKCPSWLKQILASPTLHRFFYLLNKTSTAF